MYEIAAFINRPRKALPLCVIQFPSGKWGFVGTVPAELAYSGPADAIEIGMRHGMGFVRHRGVKTMTWDSKESALAAADAIGAEVTT